MGRRNFYTISNFYCPDCNTTIPLPRIHGQQRERGHVKDLWCPACKEKKKFKEIRAMDVYKTLDGEVVYE